MLKKKSQTICETAYNIESLLMILKYYQLSWLRSVLYIAYTVIILVNIELLAWHFRKYSYQKELCEQFPADLWTSKKRSNQSPLSRWEFIQGSFITNNNTWTCKLTNKSKRKVRQKTIHIISLRHATVNRTRKSDSFDGKLFPQQKVIKNEK